MKNANIEVIYSMKLAGYLMMRGFVLIGTEQVQDEAKRNVFFFKKSPELSSAMNDYSLLRKGRRK